MPQQQLLHLQIQQQILQQELVREALIGSPSRLSGVPCYQPGIPAVSMHMGQQQGYLYSQLLSTQLAQGDLQAPRTDSGNSSVAHEASPTFLEGRSAKATTASLSGSFVFPSLPPPA
jgi:hypothetical protein